MSSPFQGECNEESNVGHIGDGICMLVCSLGMFSLFLWWGLFHWHNKLTFSDNNTTFVVTVSAGKYFLDNVQGKTLTLKKGYTYDFNTQDSSTGSHPFYLGTGSTGGNYADEYTSGVTNSRTTSGILTFVVPQAAPKELYYNCGVHSNMGAAITIVD